MKRIPVMIMQIARTPMAHFRALATMVSLEMEDTVKVVFYYALNFSITMLFRIFEHQVTL